MKKSLIILGHVSLIITTLLAIVFYKERVLFADPGQQIFEMINEGGYKIFVGRYSMAINQTLPLLAIKLGLPLKFVLLAYSLSFVLIFYLSFLISVYGFKNIGAGLGIAFTPILIRTAFGHSISEAWLGIAYSAVFYAILNHYSVLKAKGPRHLAWFYLLIVVVLVINYFIHPITLFTLGFAVGFTYFNKKQYTSAHIYIIAVLVVVPYLYKFLFPGHAHEESFFAGIKMADQLLPHIGRLPVFEFCKQTFFSIYFIVFVLLGVAAISYAKANRLKAYMFALGFVGFYFIISCLAFYKGDGHYALESRVMPIAFMVVIVFVEILKDKNKNWMYTGGILLMLAFTYYNLTQQVIKTHTKRIHLYEKLLARVQTYPEKKFYIRFTPEQGMPGNSWGPAAETLMLSSIGGKEQSRTIVFISTETDLNKGMHYWPCMFLWVPWYQFHPEDQLNKKYFDLGCTAYRELPYNLITE
jgi:hypothetical protein